MSELDTSLVKKVAKEARIKVSDEEAKRIMPAMEEIIRHFSILKSAETDGISPSFHPIDVRNALRDDKPETPIPQKDALSNVRFSKDGFIKGPRAVE
ncbi:MAG: Asp-tRNA(Asn)/Glu-tRNA(Gln) amidotransferase subunit GatC [Candidatus Micrarchaeota archaeon]|nr:Asp-tRNA(Asn)/Glu-tRNA(Gln) amidotransferase subunit GatC [Candidatus Micrarchaeota archaeon]